MHRNELIVIPLHIDKVEQEHSRINLKNEGNVLAGTMLVTPEFTTVGSSQVVYEGINVSDERKNQKRWEKHSVCLGFHVFLGRGSGILKEYYNRNRPADKKLVEIDVVVSPSDVIAIGQLQTPNPKGRLLTHGAYAGLYLGAIAYSVFITEAQIIKIREERTWRARL